MKMSQRLVTGIAAIGLIGAASAVVAAPADAAVKSSPAACQKVTPLTNTQGTNRHGQPTIYGGTLFTKPSVTTCHDLNVIGGQVGVSYTGWLYHGNGSWGACQAGPVTFHGSLIVLCSDVLPGTLEGVTASNGSGHGITVID
jgi:hypothetical protein